MTTYTHTPSHIHPTYVVSLCVLFRACLFLVCECNLCNMFVMTKCYLQRIKCIIVVIKYDVRVNSPVPSLYLYLPNVHCE